MKTKKIIMQYLKTYFRHFLKSKVDSLQSKDLSDVKLSAKIKKIKAETQGIKLNNHRKCIRLLFECFLIVFLLPCFIIYANSANYSISAIIEFIFRLLWKIIIKAYAFKVACLLKFLI